MKYLFTLLIMALLVAAPQLAGAAPADKEILCTYDGGVDCDTGTSGVGLSWGPDRRFTVVMNIPGSASSVSCSGTPDVAISYSADGVNWIAYETTGTTGGLEHNTVTGGLQSSSNKQPAYRWKAVASDTAGCTDFEVIIFSY